MDTRAQNKLVNGYIQRAQKYPYLSRHTDMTYDPSTLSEGVKISDLETDAVTQC